MYWFEAADIYDQMFLKVQRYIEQIESRSPRVSIVGA